MVASSIVIFLCERHILSVDPDQSPQFLRLFIWERFVVGMKNFMIGEILQLILPVCVHVFVVLLIITIWLPGPLSLGFLNTILLFSQFLLQIASDGSKTKFVFNLEENQWHSASHVRDDRLRRLLIFQRCPDYDSIICQL